MNQEAKELGKRIKVHLCDECHKAHGSDIDRLVSLAGGAEPRIVENEILVAITRPEDYEDVHPELVMQDAAIHPEFAWRIVAGAEPRQERKPLSEEQMRVLSFLWGACNLAGVGFGTLPEGVKAPFWWRAHLVAAFPELRTWSGAADPQPAQEKDHG